MDSRPTVLSLCAGIGGIDLAVQRVFPAARLVCAVEIEAFAVAVLAHQMAQGQLDAAPVWTDLRTFNSRDWRGCVDLLTAGFPCQPFSVAGKQRGSLDPRHLWPSVRRAINGARPGAVLLENVPGLLTVRQPDGRTAYEVVRSELQRLAYRVEAVLVTAAEVGATHKRERLFILGMDHATSTRRQWWEPIEGQAIRHDTRSRQLSRRRDDVADATSERRPEGSPIGSWHGGMGEASSSEQRTGSSRTVYAMGHADESGLEGRQRPIRCSAYERPAWPPGPADDAGWRYVFAHWPNLAPALESPLRGVADELPTRVDELRAFGNAVVPAQGAYALRLLLEKHGIRKVAA